MESLRTSLCETSPSFLPSYTPFVLHGLACGPCRPRNPHRPLPAARFSTLIFGRDDTRPLRRRPQPRTRLFRNDHRHDLLHVRGGRRQLVCLPVCATSRKGHHCGCCCTRCRPENDCSEMEQTSRGQRVLRRRSLEACERRGEGATVCCFNRLSPACLRSRASTLPSALVKDILY